MPNWVDNTVYIKHKDKTVLERIYNSAKESHLLNDFYPIPKELEENGGWYDWCVTHWGTKWDIDLIDTNYYDDETVAVYFNSAWSPPVAWYEYMTEQGYEIEATYNEPGMCFCGSYTSEDGEDYYEYADMNAEDLPIELRDIYDLDNYIAELKESEEE